MAFRPERSCPDQPIIDCSPANSPPSSRILPGSSCVNQIAEPVLRDDSVLAEEWLTRDYLFMRNDENHQPNEEDIASSIDPRSDDHQLITAVEPSIVMPMLRATPLILSRTTEYSEFSSHKRTRLSICCFV